jgi:O-antigen ligase
MKRWSSAQLLRATEFVYASLALFALTQGPVYQIWKYSAEQLTSLPSPSLPFVYFATFLAMQAPAVVLLARRAHGTWFAQRSSQALLALHTWLGLSVLWSTFARHSLPETVALMTTAAFGAYLATSYTPRQLWWIIASAMTLGVALSWFAIMRLWEGAYNFVDSYWIGIYLNRNSLAPVAAMGIIAACGVVLSEWSLLRQKPVFWCVFVATPATMLVVFSAIELRESESQTSPLALLAGVSSVVLWLLLRWVGAKASSLRALKSFAAPITFVVLGVVLLTSLLAVGGFGGVSTEVATLNSRRAFWSLSWSAILEKPWLGWGWMAAWRSPDFYNYGLWVPEWDTVWSHNGYHDILLGGGAVAGVLFVLSLWFGSVNLRGKSLNLALPNVMLTAFVLSAATQESFFIGSHFLWALLVAALFGHQSKRKSVDKQDAS